ncbi:hypothetical protein FPV67DRAFT_1449283 [Lyophyllum atratum]|nr:hypothetical protein FPV67DRAFT_1449283 [Lyophyllum atratum]
MALDADEAQTRVHSEGYDRSVDRADDGGEGSGRAGGSEAAEDEHGKDEYVQLAELAHNILASGVDRAHDGGEVVGVISELSTTWGGMPINVERDPTFDEREAIEMMWDGVR